MLIAGRAAATVERLNRALAEREAAGVFPAASLTLTGENFESAEALRDALAASRIRDAESGRTHAGPHLTDLAARHTAKRADARDCSTGEQKALLISIMLADARELSRARDGMAPLLLLDEIAAHLDAVRRAALFEEIAASGRPGLDDRHRSFAVSTAPAPKSSWSKMASSLRQE